MGIYVSNPFLAKKSALAGALGTVSGTGCERILVHLLQLGDIGGHYRRAMSHFPFPEVVERILARYYIAGGKPTLQKFRQVPAFSLKPSRDLIELTVLASFCFVWLAKEGHDRPISVNYLEKMQMGHIYHLTGAMMADVDYVTMGAGITLQIPAALDAIASGGVPSYRIHVEGSKDGPKTMSFDPEAFFGKKLLPMRRPGFLPIVSTDVLAKVMVSKLLKDSVQGFVIELPTAGGHNAPPRVKGNFDETGQPVYGPKDEVDFAKLRELGIPFWIAGSYASPEALAKAQALGAVGIQAGSLFALSDDSGFVPAYRAEMRRQGYRGELVIRTDPRASPTGFPIKLVQIKGSMSDPVAYSKRDRICNLSALQFLHQMESDGITLRCPSEPFGIHLRKGGKPEDTIGAVCLCNGLFAAVGLGNHGELPAFTMGDDVSFLRHLMRDERDSYTAADAIAWLLSGQQE